MCCVHHFLLTLCFIFDAVCRRKMDSKAVSKHLFIRLYSLNFSFRRTIFFSWNSIFSLNFSSIRAVFFANEFLFGTNEREKKNLALVFRREKMNDDDNKNKQTHFSSRFSVFADSFVRLSHLHSTFDARYIVFWLQNSWTFATIEWEKRENLIFSLKISKREV